MKGYFAIGIEGGIEADEYRQSRALGARFRCRLYLHRQRAFESARGTLRYIENASLRAVV